MEQSLVLLKPDAIKRRLIGTIIAKYEQKGLYIHKLKLLKPSRELVREHYAEHKNKPFFTKVVDYLSASAVVAMVVAGDNAVAVVRKLNGVTNPVDAELGSIRGDYGMCVGRNVVHGSESVEAARREIGLWFGEDDGDVDTFDAAVVYED
ncbi:Nucleoside diphosphate kinase [Trachipleistophora hominis]|uniref:Nucleoside diphosphate kinase n=1 Tax=Trachipleistophora hominis TaxID=72359 RepID=L7JXK1_TRAHO|nr:Nucleoside diphosphate kinase [Trachipleistophora hominis]